METRLGRKKKTGKVGHTRVTKCQQTFYRTPSCKTHHQEGGPDAQTEKKVVNKKTVKGILKLRPKLIEGIYVQVCSGTQNLCWLKRNVLAYM